MLMRSQGCAMSHGNQTFRAGLRGESHIGKTPKGEEEIRSRCSGLRGVQRQLLIVANGRTRASELIALADSLGAGSSEIHALIESAFLQVVEANEAAGDEPIGAQAEKSASEENLLAAPADAVLTAADSGVARKRSLAAAKMYLIDMLSRMPDESAQTSLAMTRRASSQEDLVAALDHFCAGEGVRPEILTLVRRNTLEMLPEAF